MRIAIVSEVFLPKIDGVVNRTLQLLHNLKHFGDEVMIVCPQATGCDNIDLPVVAVPSFPFPMYPEYRVGLPDRSLAVKLRKFAPDVLHYINPFAFGFRCYDVLQRAGLKVPTVFSFHTLYGEFVKKYRAMRPLSKALWWLTREYHNRADVNMTVSDIQQQDLINRGFERVELWPPAVDTQLFHPSRSSPVMRHRLSGGSPEKPLLLTVSRLAPEKNVDFLAEVLPHLPDVNLAIVGDGPHRPKLERRFSGSRAHFLGYLKGKDLAEAYASADGFLYASEMETMGNVVLEAMASGCAVIAPNSGGIPSLLSHGRTGLLYRPGNLDDIVGAARTILGDSELRRRIQIVAREAVQDQTWRNSVARVREVYAQAIDQRLRRIHRSKPRERLAFVAMTTLVSLFRSLPTARSRVAN
jgi:glycosyltransferase involved in cell wall biosynthesis